MKTTKFMAAALMISSSIALATADGPDFYSVRGVAKNDVLNLRSDHSARSTILEKIPPTAKNIKNLGVTWPKYDSDAPPSKEMLEDRNDLSKEEKEILLKGISWCKVEFNKKQGWVLCKYLGE